MILFVRLKVAGLVKFGFMIANYILEAYSLTIIEYLKIYWLELDNSFLEKETQPFEPNPLDSLDFTK